MSSTDPTAWFEIHVQDGPRARACRGAMPGAKPETPGAPCDGPAHGFISPAWIAVEAGREQVAGGNAMRESRRSASTDTSPGPSASQAIRSVGMLWHETCV